MVQTKDIHETRPRFECVSCHERFWISYPECASLEEVVGLRTLTPAPVEQEKSDKNCPKCHKTLDPAHEECPHCGVIPKKFLGLKTASRIQGSERLSVMWKKIIDDYTNQDLHREFLKISSIENNLAYASAQYAQLLKVIPQEETAHKMIREIEALVAVPISQNQSVRVHKVRPKTPGWVQGVLVAGALITAIGIFFPLLRNVTGIGAVLVFLALGYQLKLFRL